MKRALALILAVLPLAASAQVADELEEPGALDEGLGLIEEGARDILRGLVDEAQPALEGIAGIGADLLPTFQLLAREMGPAFAEVIGQVDSITNYEPPAFLPNGDIVMRRRDEAPAFVPPAADAGPAPEVEL